MDSVGSVLGILVTALLTISGLIQGGEALLSVLERVRQRRKGRKAVRQGKPGTRRPDKQPLVWLTQRGVVRFIAGLAVLCIAVYEIQPLARFYSSFPAIDRWGIITAIVPYLIFLAWYPVVLARRGHKWLLRGIATPLLVEVCYANVGFFEPSFYETTWYVAVGGGVHALCYSLFHTGLVVYFGLEFIGPWLARLPER